MSLVLRDYQQRTIDHLYGWFGSNPNGHPCLVLPTGAGKSIVVAELCRDALQSWPETRVLMLTHVKELIEQNAEKIRAVWPGAPLGIYSASLRRRDEGEPITFAGIQSVRDKADMLGHVDLVIIDECHLLNNDKAGGYRRLLNALMRINPALRVIGLTATPYRLGQGLLTDGEDSIFTDLIEPVTIEELVHKGYLSKLSSKKTATRFDLTGVHKRGGEFIESELAAAVDNDLGNEQVVAEIVQRAEGRQSWLVFCTSVAHAEHICGSLRARGVVTECLTGETPKAERERIIADFKAKRITALTNCNILTTGFDAPDIDLIAMVRPTMSPGLYVQMAGRGLRVKSHTDHCLVLDFAENVARHGPITNVEPPGKKGSGEAPVKVCPSCDEVVHLSAKVCPSCGHEFVPDEKEKAWRLSDADIMGDVGAEMSVRSWRWSPHTSRASGKQMIRVSYYGASLSDAPVVEYFPLLHEGYAGQKASRTVATIAAKAGVELFDGGLDGISQALSGGQPPRLIAYRKDGRFFRIVRREWND